MAASRAPVTLQPTTDWNQEAFKPAPELLAFEVMSDVAPEGWLRLSLAGTVRSPAGTATPGGEQSYTVETERAFFIDRFSCTFACNPDYRNPVVFRSRVKVEDFAKATTVVDAADGKPIARPAAPSLDRDRDRDIYIDDNRYVDDEQHLTLEDAGFQRAAEPQIHRHDS